MALDGLLEKVVDAQGSLGTDALLGDGQDQVSVGAHIKVLVPGMVSPELAGPPAPSVVPDGRPLLQPPDGGALQVHEEPDGQRHQIDDVVKNRQNHLVSKSPTITINHPPIFKEGRGKK